MLPPVKDTAWPWHRREFIRTPVARAVGHSPTIPRPQSDSTERLPELLPSKKLLDSFVPQDAQIRHVRTLMHGIQPRKYLA
jgi:hypothetical protein